MSDRPPPKGSRDRQQRVPSGPRPSRPRHATGPEDGSRATTLASRQPTATLPSVTDGGLYANTLTRTTSPEELSTSPPPRIKSPKSKPTALRLNTLDLLAPETSPNKPVSPSLQHWQQVRNHVFATPAEERAAQSLARTAGNDKKKVGLVQKAAGRFGLKQAADRVIRGDERRKSTMAMEAEFGVLSLEQREEIARERRRFARDVKGCLDSCATEETRRRLERLGRGGKNAEPSRRGTDGRALPSLHGSQQAGPSRQQYDTGFYAFAPLLTELHRHMPDARAKKPWSRTCPHHAAILAELRTAFLDDSVSTDGERQQALEVFGTVVRNWSAENPIEELSRWLWLCQVLKWDDKQIRDRGLALLGTLLKAEDTVTDPLNRPYSALSIQNLGAALVRLLQALESSRIVEQRHVDMVNGFLSDLGDGQIIDLDETTVGDLIDEYEFHGSQGGVCRELLWTGAGIALGTDVAVAGWLLRDGALKLRRFCPPTILHGAPPSVIHLRSRALIYCLTSLVSIASRLDEAQMTEAWNASAQLLEPDLVEVESGDGVLALAWANYLVAMGLSALPAGSEDAVSTAHEDPFRMTISRPPQTTVRPDCHETILRYLDMGDIWRQGLETAARSQIATAPFSQACGFAESLLNVKALFGLGEICVEALWKRLPNIVGDQPPLEAFLRTLQSKRPQVLYKPLFACSAAATAASLSGPLELVRALSTLLGPEQFWLRGDPEMVAIVLMGNAGSKVNKGKDKEGQKSSTTVKLGRYAILIELLKAFTEAGRPGKFDSRIVTFVEKLESRVGMMLESEEKLGQLPDDYRALVCRLLRDMRHVTKSVKRPLWRRNVISWYLDRRSDSTSPAKVNGQTTGIMDQLQALYRAMASKASSEVPPRSRPAKRMTGNFQAVRQVTVAISSAAQDDLLLHLRLDQELLPLFIMIQATLSSDDWVTLLPGLWAELGDSACGPPIVFLLMKCAEKCPAAMQETVLRDVKHPSATTRAGSLRKLAKLFGWRYQVLTQDTLTDRRGPIFHFSVQNLGYVSTEIGVPHWVQPQEVQDAALQKFGNTLPLELRQRLMELGWSEDDEMVGKRDWEHLPLTALPPLQAQAEDEAANKSPSSVRLGRTLSNGSGHSFTLKRRKPVFAQILSSIVGQQSLLLVGETDSIVSTTSRELVRLFQRDDAGTFFRTFGERFQDDLTDSLVHLRSVASTVTPGFAFAAVNALIGHSRTVLRIDPGFPEYVDVLTTIAKLLPGLSGASLRDIRKNRAEHVLLPASIHEDEGGYKLHAPWRDGDVEAQTAQLIILAAILRNNPRDVYLIKKMLSNLQVQASIHSVAFSRGWLLLIVHLFGTVNRNYNDRSELRHFLSNVSLILTQHHGDLLVVAHAMRVYMLCSARFRRVYASVGFNTTMGAIYLTYAAGSEPIKDCIEYAMRSFYRIHTESFVHQACITISEVDYDPAIVYRLLSSLAVRNTPKSGVTSGIRGLNQKEEVDALVQMISGPELAFSEIGTAAAERRAAKIASINFEETVFPKPNIVKLFITVVAANPASKRAVRFLDLFAGMVPHIQDDASQALLRDSVEALGRIMVRGKAGDELAMRALASNNDGGETDYIGAKVSFLKLVDAYARAGGQLSSAGVKRVLNLVPDLLDKAPHRVGTAASSIIGSLADTHLASARPAAFLRDVAPIFRTYIATIDYSGLLDSITGLIHRASYDLDTETIAVIIDQYVQPAIGVLSSASEESMAFVLPLRSSTVKLLNAAVFLRGDAWSAVEKTSPTAGLLASVILPLSLLLECPKDVDRDVVYSNLWIRLLNFVLSKPGRREASPRQSGKMMAAHEILVFQIVKIVCVRAPDTISTVKGLWNYLAERVSKMIRHAEERTYDVYALPLPRIVDWMLWTLYELLSLHRSPLMLFFRHRIQIALSRPPESSSCPSSPGQRSRGGSSSPTLTMKEQPRAPSLAPSSTWHKRVPSFQHESNIRSRQPSISQQRSRPSLSPNPNIHRSPSSRSPSHALRSSPQLGVGTSPAQQLGHDRRPSFADMSARRASRPAFDVFQGGVGMNYRFPSSSTVRQLPAEKGGGAIVHLLGAPTQVTSAISGGFPAPFNRSQTEDQSESTSEVLIKDEHLIGGLKRAVRSVQIVFGHDVELPEDEPPIRTWTVQDALHIIAEQTRLFVENEFGDLFNPTRNETTDTKGYDLQFNDDSLMTIDDKKLDDDEDEDELRVPILNISSP